MTDQKTQLEKDGKSARPRDAHLHERRSDQAQRARADKAGKTGNAGDSGNIRQNTHNQGYQQDR